MENEGEVFPPEPERLLSTCVLREGPPVSALRLRRRRPSKLPKALWLVLWDLGFELWLMKEMGEGEQGGREGGLEKARGLSSLE